MDSPDTKVHETSDGINHSRVEGVGGTGTDGYTEVLRIPI
jgi:hypothetical protein